jgi:hypothetical protein
VCPGAALEEAVVEAQGVAERVHLVVVEHADPVVQLGDVDAERPFEEYAALPAADSLPDRPRCRPAELFDYVVASPPAVPGWRTGPRGMIAPWRRPGDAWLW